MVFLRLYYRQTVSRGVRLFGCAKGMALPKALASAGLLLPTEIVMKVGSPVLYHYRGLSNKLIVNAGPDPASPIRKHKYFFPKDPGSSLPVEAQASARQAGPGMS
jgi:hypothetical protein